MTKKEQPHLIRYIFKNLRTVVGIVLVWRGIWYLLDILDEWLFDGTPAFTAIGGILGGLLLLYLPNHDLKEIEKL